MVFNKHQTFRSFAGRARVTYRPDWSVSRPWLIAVEGTVVNHASSLWEAAYYLASRYGCALDVREFRPAMIAHAGVTARAQRCRVWSSDALAVQWRRARETGMYGWPNDIRKECVQDARIQAHELTECGKFATLREAFAYSYRMQRNRLRGGYHWPFHRDY